MRATLQKIHISKVYSLSMQNIFTEQPWLVLFLPVSFSFVTKWKPCVLIITCLDGIPSQIAAFSPPQPFHHKNSNLETSKLPKTLSDQTARLPIYKQRRLLIIDTDILGASGQTLKLVAIVKAVSCVFGNICTLNWSCICYYVCEIFNCYI